MRLKGLELRRIAMPLVAPFRTSFGTERDRDVLLVRAVGADAEGWGECVAMSAPLYSSEHVDGAAEVIRRFFAPALAGVRDRVPAGVSVGIMDSVPALLDAVAGYLDAGYLRIKLKIEPGWDVEPVRAVRERFGDGVLLQVDANTAYTLGDARHLARLDPFDLLLIEQPLDEEDVLGHAALAKVIRTPVCLDESITSARAAADAISLGAAAIVNIKPGRVGGYL